MRRTTRIAVSTQMLLAAVCAAALADQTVIYQNGVGGYGGQVDNEVGQSGSNSFRNNAGTDLIYCGGGTDHQMLLRFDGLPLGVTVVSATLTLETATGTGPGAGDPFYRMLQGWSGTSTYNSLVNGVQRNGVEASSVASFVAPSYVDSGPISFDATADVRAWVNGQANYGWVVAGGTTDGWGVCTGTYANYIVRPKLTVVYGVSRGQDTWTDLSGDHVWNTTSTNWLIGSAANRYPEGDWVTFNDSGAAGHYNVTIPARVNPSRMIVSNNAGNYAFGGAGSIGNGFGAYLSKLGKGTMTLGTAGRNTFTGGVSVYQGALVLDLSATPTHTDMIDSGANLVMSGGALVVKGNSSGTSSQAFASVNLESGASTVAIDAASVATTLNLGCLTHSMGSTVDFKSPPAGSKIMFSTTPTSGYLLGYGTIDGTDWAIGAADGSVVANPTYVANTWGSGNHTNVTASGNVAAGASTRTLRFNAPMDTTLTAAGTATLTSGGILVTANVGAHHNRITGGYLTSTNYKDLVVIQNNTQGTLTIESVIINTLADVSTGLTVSGVGVVVVTAANTYPGITTINKGILSTNLLNNGGLPSGIGNCYGAAANLVLNQGTLRYTGGVASTNRLFTLGPGGGRLEASGTGTINFSNSGSVVFFQNTPAVLTLAGTNSGANIFNPRIVDPDAAHQYATTLVKAGPGTWILTNTNLYTGGTEIQEGTLQIGNGASNGTPGAGTILNHGTLAISRTGALNLSDPIIGSGALRQSGGGTTTLTGAANYSGLTTVQTGRLVFSGGVSHHLGAVSLTGGSLMINAGTTVVSKGVTAESAGVWTIGGTHQLAAGALTAGTTRVRVAPVIVGTGTLDLTDNGMIVQSDSGLGNKGELVMQLGALLNQGRHGGDWLGAGITSSTVAADAVHLTLGLFDNADLGLDSFGGQAVDADALFITTSLLADADNDSQIDADDFGRWYAHARQLTYLTGNGDFDLSGEVDGKDFDLWYGAAGSSAQPTLEGLGLDRAALSAVRVPEPATLVVVGWGIQVLLLLRRRARRASRPAAPSARMARLVGSGTGAVTA